MSQDRNHLSHATWECKYHVDSRRANQAAPGHCISRACQAQGMQDRRRTPKREELDLDCAECGRQLRNFLGHKLWARGYFVSTVGRDEETIRTYIRNQEMADKQLDQLQLKLATS